MFIKKKLCFVSLYTIDLYYICMGICVLHVFLEVAMRLESPKALYKFSIIIIIITAHVAYDK